MKILVTGGTGFLGQHLVARLVELGHQVRVIARSKPATSSAEFVQGDLQDRAAVRRAIEGVEAIYHLAGLVSFRPADGRKMFELHVDATRELLRDVRDAGTRPRLILASTSGTIAVSKEPHRHTEADDYPITVVGRWPYYLSKIYQEKLCLEFCKKHELPLVVLNPSLFLGPGDERLSSTWTVMKFLNRDYPAMPNGGGSFIDVRDAAEAFANALTRGELYGRHLMGVDVKLSDLFARLERLTGVPAPRARLPSTLNVLGAQVLERFAKLRGVPAPVDPGEVDVGEHFFYFDASKAEAELGFRPRDLQQTLFDTVQDLLARMPPHQLPGVKGRLADLRGA